MPKKPPTGRISYGGMRSTKSLAVEAVALVLGGILVAYSLHVFFG